MSVYVSKLSIAGLMLVDVKVEHSGDARGGERGSSMPKVGLWEVGSSLAMVSMDTARWNMTYRHRAISPFLGRPLILRQSLRQLPSWWHPCTSP